MPRRISACWAVITSTWVCWWVSRNCLMAGASSGTVAALTVPRRTCRTLRCCSSAAFLSRSNESSRSRMCGKSSRPESLIRAPWRPRSSRSTPSSRSRLRTEPLSAGWEMCNSSAARRNEPSRATTATYSSCSIRIPPPFPRRSSAEPAIPDVDPAPPRHRAPNVDRFDRKNLSRPRRSVLDALSQPDASWRRPTVAAWSFPARSQRLRRGCRRVVTEAALASLANFI